MLEIPSVVDYTATVQKPSHEVKFVSFVLRVEFLPSRAEADII